jgi:hypothetical protein
MMVLLNVAFCALYPSSRTPDRSLRMQYAVAGGWWLTCSETSVVSPASSVQVPRKSSPRKGLRGFFSLPNCSLRLAYWCLSVERNHLRTRAARQAGSDSATGAVRSGGCVAQ